MNATVNAASAFGAFNTFQAGATGASVLALTEGMLMTMKLAQLKWLGLGILAVSLTAGSVVAVSTASAPRPEAGAFAAAFPIIGQDRGNPVIDQPSAAARDAKAPADDRLDALERKVDQLLRLLGETSTGSSSVSTGTAATGMTMSTTIPTGSLRGPVGRRAVPNLPEASTGKAGSTQVSLPTPAASASTTQNPASYTAGPNALRDNATNPGSATVAIASSMNLDPRPQPLSLSTLHELDVQLKLALESFDRTERLYKQGALSAEERAQSRGKVLLAAAVLEGLGEDLDEETGRIKLEILKKRAEKEAAVAHTEAVAAVVARNSELNERKPGVVSDSDIAKNEFELQAAQAQPKIKMVEIEILSLRLEHLSVRRDRINKLLPLARRAEAGN
jgi:hypothetical protein